MRPQATSPHKMPKRKIYETRCLAITSFFQKKIAAPERTPKLLSKPVSEPPSHFPSKSSSELLSEPSSEKRSKSPSNSHFESTLTVPANNKAVKFDKASSLNAVSPPSDLSEKHQPIFQPDIQFPVTHKRKFSSHWYKQFPWIEYSVQQDKVFCKPCRFFTHNSKTEELFTITGFNNWKKTGDKCAKHSDSYSHKAATESFMMFKQAETNGRVDQQLDPLFKNSELMSKHHKHIRTVLDIILFLAQQEIPFRGHNEMADSLNRGNFLELFDLICQYNPAVKERFDDLPSNSKLMSPDIQNDLIESSKRVFLDIVKSEIHTAKIYAILADEVKDASKKELLGVSLRYLHDGLIKERVIGFIELESLSAASITHQLLLILEPFNLPKNDCVGQSYDGASVMSGDHGGVQALMKNNGYTRAQYFHCASHRLNLVLSSVATTDSAVQNFFDVLDSVYSFFTGIKRHACFLAVQKEMFPKEQRVELIKASETRWSSRSLQMDRFLCRFECILNTLSLLENDRDTDTKLAAISLLKTIQTQHFLILLIFFNKLFHMSDFCTKGLQQIQTNVETTLNLIETFKKQINEFCHEDVIEYGMSLSKKFNITEFTVTKSSRHRSLPASLRDSFVMSTVGQNTNTSVDDLVIVMKRVIGHIAGEIDSRFSKKQQDVMRAVEAFCPSSASFMDEAILNSISQFYGLNITDSELEVFKKFVKRSVCTDANLFEIFSLANVRIFPNIHELIKILLTIPQTSVTVERLFSTVKRVKTRMRSLMTTSRLSGLAVLSFEKETIKKLDRSKVIEEFRCLKNRRLL